jgi:integrase
VSGTSDAVSATTQASSDTVVPASPTLLSAFDGDTGSCPEELWIRWPASSDAAPSSGLEPSNVRRELSRICSAAGVPRITPNELRHTCATLLNDEGVPLELIADMLGHTTTTMLQRHYRHRVRPSADAAVGPMDGLFGGRDDQPSSADSRERMNSANASAETSRRDPSRNDRNSPALRKR